MDCPHCDITLSNIDKYLFHLQYIHKNDIFTCHVNNCLRTFHRKDSFKKHISTHEFLSINVNLKDVGSSMQTEESSSHSNADIDIKSEPQIENVSNNVDKVEVKVDISCFLKNLYIAIQHLIAELYNLSLTKRDIQKIIEIFENFISSELLYELKKIIMSCDLTEVVTSLKNISKYFKTFSTDYKENCFLKILTTILNHPKLS